MGKVKMRQTSFSIVFFNDSGGKLNVGNTTFSDA